MDPIIFYDPFEGKYEVFVSTTMMGCQHSSSEIESSDSIITSHAYLIKSTKGTGYFLPGITNIGMYIISNTP